MKGEDLLKALSSIDEGYIQEAENGKPRKPILFWLAPVAACLAAALLLGLGRGYSDRISMEKNDSAEVFPEGLPEWTFAAANQEPTFNRAPDAAPEMNEPPADSWLDSSGTCEVPSLEVRIDRWLENGFEATVTRIVDTEAYPVGTQVKVRFPEEKISIAEILDGGIHFRCDTPTPEEFPEGSVVQILFVTDNGVLFAEQIAKEDVL